MRTKKGEEKIGVSFKVSAIFERRAPGERERATTAEDELGALTIKKRGQNKERGVGAQYSNEKAQTNIP